MCACVIVAMSTVEHGCKPWVWPSCSPDEGWGRRSGCVGSGGETQQPACPAPPARPQIEAPQMPISSRIVRTRDAGADAGRPRDDQTTPESVSPHRALTNCGFWLYAIGPSRTGSITLK